MQYFTPHLSIYHQHSLYLWIDSVKNPGNISVAYDSIKSITVGDDYHRSHCLHVVLASLQPFVGLKSFASIWTLDVTGEPNCLCL